MYRFVREINQLAQQIISDLQEIRTDSNDSIHSTDILSRIEQKIDTVCDNTNELIERVPHDLTQILIELKASLITKLDQTANGANHSPKDIIDSLTHQEKRIFQLCFRLGFMSYSEIASHLHITPIAAKNLVNRIFQSQTKRPLFIKKYTHGQARVGIQPVLEKRILTGRNYPKKQKKGKVPSKELLVL